MLPQLTWLKEAALDLILPKRCLGCDKEGAYICSSCARKLPKVLPPVCPLCGIPQINQSLCPSCTKHHYQIDGIRSPFRFEGMVRQAVYQFKYNNLRDIAQTLAELMAEYIKDNPVPGEILVPVPLHSKRLKRRGYNQSQLLARELGKITGMQVATDYLQRTRPTPPQTDTAGLQQRLENVSGAFTAGALRLKKQPVILIDDVATSGATLNACAMALKQAGAATVWGLTLARDIIP